MIQVGRKAIPINLQVLNGNPNRLTKAEIEARQEAEKKIRAKNDKIRPPTWLDKLAKREFRKIVKEMEELDLLTNLDVHALAIYCDAYSQYVECTKQIDEEGLMVEYTNKAAETNKVPHPLMTKKKQLHEQMRSLATEFGFTPASRAKLAIPREEPKPKTAFEQRFGEV